MIGGWEEPGEYRIEVLLRENVEFLFSVFVDVPLPPVGSLPMPVIPETPEEAEAALWGTLQEVRRSLRLPMLRAFPLIRPYLEAQAACLDRYDLLAHRSPQCPSVPDRSHERLYPHPRHWEIVASGENVAEIRELLWYSPAHMQTLACTECAAAEIAVRAAPEEGLIAVIELLGFPHGEAREVRQE